MPRGDGTGPAGMGPMTGRGAGYCAGYGMPGFMNRPGGWFGRGMAGQFGGGFGRGMRRGGGRGFRHMYYATGLPGWMRGGAATWDYRAAEPEEEKSFLRRQAEGLRAELDEIEKRLEDLETGPESE